MWKERYYLFVDRIDDGPMESGMLYAHKILKVPGSHIFTLGEAPQYTAFDVSIGDAIEGVCSLSNSQGLTKITLQDRLDVMGHGHPGSITKFDGTRLNAFALACELISHGLREVGYLKIQACNILRETDDFLIALRNELTAKGVKVGYLAGTRKYISQTSTFRGHRDNPAGQPSSIDERFRHIKGNIDIPSWF